MVGCIQEYLYSNIDKIINGVIITLIATMIISAFSLLRHVPALIKSISKYRISKIIYFILIH